jgi:hypothetical protein
MGYATMHYCQVLIIVFSALMDLVMVAISWNAIKNYLHADMFKMIIFWYLFVFAIIKLVVALFSYIAFK